MKNRTKIIFLLITLLFNYYLNDKCRLQVWRTENTCKGVPEFDNFVNLFKCRRGEVGFNTYYYNETHVTDKFMCDSNKCDNCNFVKYSKLGECVDYLEDYHPHKYVACFNNTMKNLNNYNIEIFKKIKKK
jgi:hypothetical protein